MHCSDLENPTAKTL